MRRRLPEAGTAHSLMLEACLRGRQYCLDGYCFEGGFRRLGIVDAVMYPGTDAFMRWDYPSHLPERLQQQAEAIAARFLREIGFNHGFFNMEVVLDEHSGQLKVIEFNPRMAAQIQRDFKWLGSYRYGIVDLGGTDPADLRRRCEHASSLLGWTAPYVEYATDLPGFSQDGDAWPAAIRTGNASG